MNMESNRELGSKQIAQAKHLFMRYVVLLVVVYLGFVVTTELLLEDNVSIFYIESALAGIIFGVLLIVIFKALKGIRLIKKSEEWR